jgi:histidine decarboxylase
VTATEQEAGLPVSAPVVPAPRRPGVLMATWTTTGALELSPQRAAADLAELCQRLETSRPTNIGFPSTFGLDISPLWPLFNQVLNNVGDPYAGSAFPANTKAIEQQVIDVFADLLHAPAHDRWGYVTNGGTEGNEYGLLQGRTLHPDATLYYSTAAHYSVAKLAAKLRIPAVAVRALNDGRMDLRDLRTALRADRQRAAIVLATIGATMTEAIDDVAAIRRALADIPVPRAYVHADAALAGLPLALLTPPHRPKFDLADGADSVSISGHKFLGSPIPCGVVITRRMVKERISTAIDLLDTHDTTISGSRSGHAPLVLWYALNLYGLDGLHQRAQAARAVAAYAVTRLTGVGWRATRYHPAAMTVVIDPPPAAVRARWAVPVSGNRAHIICTPAITREQIDAFADDLAAHRDNDTDEAVSP